MLAPRPAETGRQSPAAMRSFLGDVTNTPVAKSRASHIAVPPPLSRAELSRDPALMNESPMLPQRCWPEAFASPVHAGRREPASASGSFSLLRGLQAPTTPSAASRPQAVLPMSRAHAAAACTSPAARATPSHVTPTHSAAANVLGSRNSSFVCNPSGRSSNRVSPHRRETDDVEPGHLSTHTTLADHFADMLVPMLLDEPMYVPMPPPPPLAESFRTLMELDMSVFEIPAPIREELET